MRSSCQNIWVQFSGHLNNSLALETPRVSSRLHLDWIKTTPLYFISTPSHSSPHVPSLLLLVKPTCCGLKWWTFPLHLIIQSSVTLAFWPFFAQLRRVRLGILHIISAIWFAEIMYLSFNGSPNFTDLMSLLLSVTKKLAALYSVFPLPTSEIVVNRFTL